MVLRHADLNVTIPYTDFQKMMCLAGTNVISNLRVPPLTKPLFAGASRPPSVSSCFFFFAQTPGIYLAF